MLLRGYQLTSRVADGCWPVKFHVVNTVVLLTSEIKVWANLMQNHLLKHPIWNNCAAMEILHKLHRLSYKHPECLLFIHYSFITDVSMKTPPPPVQLGWERGLCLVYSKGHLDLLYSKFWHLVSLAVPFKLFEKFGNFWNFTSAGKAPCRDRVLD